MPKHSPHLIAVLQALLVTFLWATSWVLIKIGLGSLPALTFAGLRYGLASLILLPFVLRPARLAALRRLPRRMWLLLMLLGLLHYSAAQGAQFVALSLLDAISTNLLLSFITVVVTLLGMGFLGEHPHPLQWIGLGLYIVGVIVYFIPITLQAGAWGGIVAALVCVVANSAAAILGRGVNRTREFDPLTITAISMSIGSVALLTAGVITQGMPSLTAQHWLIIVWLALVNTSFAFTLWNHTQRTLTAMESSIIGNLMLAFIPLLAWLFLGEEVTLKEGIGMLLVGAGILTVQLRRRPSAVSPVLEEAA